MRSSGFVITMICIFISNGCNDSVQVTDVSGNQSNFVEYPCLSSEDDCMNIIKIDGGNFQFYSSFHIDSPVSVSSSAIK
mgnify:CR=1 FL=1